ncbi:MAG: ATP-binding cassette domain-containing protein [Bacteroidales bacterium]|nr:ATP-binding cassette domain-containing protein [Bacteroidales bacterium]
MIALKNVYKSFGDNSVLEDISVFFEQGKTNLIIGQSGSGKTVLLKSIIGLHQIDSGEIIYGDKEFSRMPIKEKKEIRKEIGMVFQGGALFDSATVEENVMFPLEMFTNMTKAEMLDRVNFCLSKVNLENVNKLYPAEISGGMQKRVSIARAIALNPKYLFCDEPNSGLDPKTAIVIDQLIRELTLEFNMTTVVNTHDMNSVIEIGDKIVFIFEGKKWWEGNRDDILTTENKELEEFIFASDLMRKFKHLKVDL